MLLSLIPLPIKIFILLGAVSAAFGGGMYTMNAFNEADRLEMAELQIAAQKEVAERAQELFKRQRQIDSESYQKFQIAAQRANADLQQTKMELNRYVEAARNPTVDNRESQLGAYQAKTQCPSPLVDHVPVGVVGLLNKARIGGSDPGVPVASGPPDAESRQSSTVTYGVEIEYHLECGEQYRALKARHDGLVDWIADQQTLVE